MSKSFKIVAVLVLGFFLSSTTYAFFSQWGQTSVNSQMGRVKIYTDCRMSRVANIFAGEFTLEDLVVLLGVKFASEHLSMFGFAKDAIALMLRVIVHRFRFIIDDPLVIQVPEDATNFKAVVGYSPRETDLVVRTFEEKLPVAPGRWIHPETGHKLIVVDLPEGFDIPEADETPEEFHFEFEFDLAEAREVVLKFVPAAKVQLDDLVYYPTVVSDMADAVPFIVDRNSGWKSFQVDPEYQLPDAFEELVYDFTPVVDGLRELFFCHIAAGDGVWKSELGIVNDSDGELSGMLIAKDDSGNVVETHQLALPPHGRVEIDAEAFFSNPEQIGYAVFVSEDEAKGYQKFWMDGSFRVAVPAVPDTGITRGTGSSPMWHPTKSGARASAC